ncbi:hypothetical protein QYE76_049174 [Lolium multiflorum]|uniref:Uncharacterized protein n=1 Tax=Lolium multiflorum TaxID=4521 RepID=A0AAD8WI23_LOLMU|nr:hypothetical protein QYE76_049174 [Lolium multiflorum]
MEEDLEKQMVLEQSIESAWQDEEVIHRVVEDSFETPRGPASMHGCAPRRKVAVEEISGHRCLDVEEEDPVYTFDSVATAGRGNYKGRGSGGGGIQE